MLLSSPLLNNTFWRIGLVSCLLVYLTKAQEFRQQELLHGQLRDGKVEYILLPRCTVPIKSIKASMDLGLTETVKVFPDSVKSLDRKCKKKADLHAGIYALHNARADNNESVGMTRIFRLEKGETSEYLADINGRGQCFGTIWKWVSANSIGSGGYMEAPENIREELEELCNDGFLALEPSPDLAGLDGTYVGNGLRKSLALEFDQGTLMKANLRVSEVNDDFRMAMFYPLCDGIISVIPQIGLPTENQPTYLILEKVRRRKERARQIS
ncbi:hypothetical protein FOZ60_014334 [Perkinsus olseni]|uniref:Uncharacterized protein n=1 Tax=Perkinsus olseni TaxID=32597 RepID=A0A7J6P7D2_PEROL|nr:hypothetical protein FOZ60_014334 [Perkinsus olseni]